jgi:hypothetical protein
MEQLRQEIGKLTKSGKNAQPLCVSRVIFISLNKSLDDLRKTYFEHYPLYDPLLEMVYRWITVDDDAPSEVFQTRFDDVWQEIMAPELINAFAKSDFSLLDNIIQIVFVTDLSAEKSNELLNSYKSLIDSTLRKWSAKALVFFSCIALLRNFDHKANKTIPTADVDLFLDWSRNNLHRLYAVDITNYKGTFITQSSDLHSFLGQMVYFITNIHAECVSGSVDSSFEEWLNGVSPNNDHASSFSAFTYAFPSEYVLEVCLVSKGAESIRQALFGEPDETRSQFYMNSIINEHGFSSYNVLREFVFKKEAENNESEVLSVIHEVLRGNQTSCDNESIDLHITTYDKINDALPLMIAQNESIFIEQSINVPVSFNHTLLENVKTILVEETGSIKILDLTLEKLQTHLANLKPESKAPPEDNFENLKSQLEQEKDKAPKQWSVIGRLIILTVLAGLTLFDLITSLNYKFGLSVFLIVIFLIIHLVYKWRMAKKRIERLYILMEKLINDKWKYAKFEAQNKFISKIVHTSLSYVKQHKRQCKNVAVRLNNIITYGQKVHEPPKFTNSAFWINLIDNREQALGYDRFIGERTKLKEIQFLDTYRPIELWGRLSYAGGSILNSWELNFLQNAAKDFLPLTQELLSLSICEILENNTQELKNLIIKYSEPFLVMNKLEIPSNSCYINIPSHKCSAVKDVISDSFSGHFSNLFMINTTSYHIISFLSLAEGIEFKNIIKNYT